VERARPSRRVEVVEEPGGTSSGTACSGGGVLFVEVVDDLGEVGRVKIRESVAQLCGFGVQGFADIGEDKIRDSHGGSSAPPPDGQRVVRGGTTW
jgi:hypothetical protein